MSASKERRLPKRVSVIIGARKKRLKETKAKQDIVEEKPSTAGSDQHGELLCMPGIEIGCNGSALRAMT